MAVRCSARPGKPKGPALHRALREHGRRVESGHGWHALAPLQFLAPTHSLSGSVLLAMGRTCRSCPSPSSRRCTPDRYRRRRCCSRRRRCIGCCCIRQPRCTLRRSPAAPRRRRSRCSRVMRCARSPGRCWWSRSRRVPSMPPVFAALHAWHRPLQNEPQQTPSVQKPLAHSPAPAHVVPTAARHVPVPSQTSLPPLPVHSLAGSVPPSIERAGARAARNVAGLAGPAARDVAAHRVDAERARALVVTAAHHTEGLLRRAGAALAVRNGDAVR